MAEPRSGDGARSTGYHRWQGTSRPIPDVVAGRAGFADNWSIFFDLLFRFLGVGVRCYFVCFLFSELPLCQPLNQRFWSVFPCKSLLYPSENVVHIMRRIFFKN
ncbi:hypothetical protein KC19_5G067000 [Ceratodon purpureus]|uniref:Uncharacterized protein n=1 Tax=Ceratodon purpureus TaxID=3225 RepID=A0A8T0I036_CERPU|nr:hypothetical protein KC19_5G067000 [Ceratodon purpureus]